MIASASYYCLPAAVLAGLVGCSANGLNSA